MNNRKRSIIILVILCILLLMIGLFVCIDIFSNKNNDSLSDDKDIIDENYENNKSLIGEDQNTTNNGDVNDYREEDVINYFESMGQEVENSKSFKEKFKDYFIVIVDFIFYDGEIKGYTFSELTGITKAKIIAIALKIDSKMEEYVPGYKESISSTTGKVYTDIKERLVTSYMDVSTAICEDNKDECDKVKDIFSDVKDYCKIGWDFIKGLFKNGVSKVRDWYEIYSGK